MTENCEYQILLKIKISVSKTAPIDNFTSLLQLMSGATCNLSLSNSKNYRCERRRESMISNIGGLVFRKRYCRKYHNLQDNCGGKRLVAHHFHHLSIYMQFDLLKSGP